jgi:hypothetical protein
MGSLPRGRSIPAAQPPSRADSATITAQVSYVRAPSAPPIHYLYDPPPGIPRDTCTYEPRAVAIRDARPKLARSVDRAGFELRHAPTDVRDFLDDAEVRRVYYPEVEALALTVSGGTRAYVFDHLVRKREPGRPPMTFGRRGGGAWPSAAGRVHNDYTPASSRTRLDLVLADPGAVAAVTRFSIVNVWRSITHHPVLDTPLAVCDARTVAAEDLIPCELRYPRRVGEIYLVTYSPDHEWSYFPAMQRDEALVFKQYDSAPGVAKLTPHAAFDHPDMPPGTPPRESIEARCLIVYT